MPAVTGKMPRGEKHWRSVFTEEQIRRMRKMLDQGHSVAEIQRVVAPNRKYISVYSAIHQNWNHID